MIDTSKLKYYKELCEKGIIDEQQNDLDGIMNTLEEKQFEYLKRLETTKDESRKDEINETLNLIDLQLKELAAIKSAISAGIIIASDDKTTNNDTAEKTDVNVVGNNKRKIGLVIVVAALILVVAVVAVFSLNEKKGRKNVDSSKSLESTDSTDINNDNNETKLGVFWMDDIDTQFPSGLYITQVLNQSLVDGGLKVGDRIEKINGEKVNTSDEGAAVIAKYNPGDEAIIVVDRDSDQITIKGKYITSSEELPQKTSGEETFMLDGQEIKITYYENAEVDVTYKLNVID